MVAFMQSVLPCTGLARQKQRYRNDWIYAAGAGLAVEINVTRVHMGMIGKETFVVPESMNHGMLFGGLPKSFNRMYPSKD